MTKEEANKIIAEFMGEILYELDEIGNKFARCDALERSIEAAAVATAKAILELE